MKHNLIPTVFKLFQTYKHYMIRGSALVLVLGAGCYISYTAGRRSLTIPVNETINTIATPNTASVRQTTAEAVLEGSPSFAFAPYVSDARDTPDNAELMDLNLLNLACLYEDGADASEPASSYAGLLYSHLSQLDAKWSDGLNDLYNYTPERLAAQMGLPLQTVTAGSEVIPEFTKVNLQFLDGNGRAISRTSNARDIIAMANTLYYYGVLNNMDELLSYADKLWNSSHHYTLHMGTVYYCDGSSHQKNETEMVAEPAAGSQVEPQAAANKDASKTSLGPGMTGDSEGEAAPASDTENPLPSSDGNVDTDNRSASPKASLEGNVDQGAEVMSQPTGTPSPCPGHMDLTITVEIKGISESNGLFRCAPSALAGGRPSGWLGWRGEAVEAVRAISAQDWYEKYGINTADSFQRTPLTSAQIRAYMDMIPDDVSQMRKDFIRYALVSVGKIPYYWGGKPAAPGYTGNRFGAIMSPDEDGRLLKGLDCSGWINWLYWSVAGHGLGAEGTGTLVSSGTAIAKSQLLPGDICIRTGGMSHVVVFLGWMPDGQMMCIQETSGNINNVEVGVTRGDWPSYRRILD